MELSPYTFVPQRYILVPQRKPIGRPIEKLIGKPLGEFYAGREKEIQPFIPRTSRIPKERGYLTERGKIFSEWNRLILTLEADPAMENFLKGLNKPIVLIDSLNFIIPETFVKRRGPLRFQVASNVQRSDRYGSIASLYSDACYRTRCQETVGIAVAQLKQPISYDIEEAKAKDFLKWLALQAPNIHFIDVRREIIALEDFPYFLEARSNLKDMSMDNFSSIFPNKRIYKEIDDYMVVALYNILERMGKQAWIHTCDKYRWMNGILSPEQINSVKTHTVQPMFLNKTTALLMGYECAYDCTEKQHPSFSPKSSYNPRKCISSWKRPKQLR